jgi:hypothetical protein
MKKRIVRLTESDLRRIVRRVIKEDMGGMDDREEYDPRFYAPSPDYEEGEEWGEKEYDPRFDAPSPDYEEDDDDYSGLKDVHRKWYDQNMGKHREDSEFGRERQRRLRNRMPESYKKFRRR